MIGPTKFASGLCDATHPPSGDMGVASTGGLDPGPGGAGAHCGFYGDEDDGLVCVMRWPGGLDAWM